MLFLGLFLVLGGAEQAGITQELVGAAERLNLHNPLIFATVVTLLSNIVSNVPAVTLLKGVLPQLQDAHSAWLLLAIVEHSGRQSHHHRFGRQHHRGGKGASRGAHQLSPVHEDWRTSDSNYVGAWVGLAGMEQMNHCSKDVAQQPSTKEKRKKR